LTNQGGQQRAHFGPAASAQIRHAIVVERQRPARAAALFAIQGIHVLQQKQPADSARPGRNPTAFQPSCFSCGASRTDTETAFAIVASGSEVRSWATNAVAESCSAGVPPMRPHIFAAPLCFMAKST